MQDARAVEVQLSSLSCRVLLGLLGDDPGSLPKRRCGIPLMIAGFILLYAAAFAIWVPGALFTAFIGADGIIRFGWWFVVPLGIAAALFLSPIPVVMPRWCQRTVVPIVGACFATVGAFILASKSDDGILIFGGWLAACGTMAILHGIGVITQRWWGHMVHRLYDWACPPVTYV